MPVATHAIVERRSALIVSRHTSLGTARATWRRQGTSQTPAGTTVTAWGAAHLILPIRAATEALARRDGGLTISVTSPTHPATHAAFACLSRDAGEGERHAYLVPRRYKAILASAENALGALDETGFATVCLGTPAEVRSLIEGRPRLRDAAALLEAFFRDWHPPRRRRVAPAISPPA